jgi:predicted amidophosphoribosyltransferase
MPPLPDEPAGSTPEETDGRPPPPQGRFVWPPVRVSEQDVAAARGAEPLTPGGEASASETSPGVETQPLLSPGARHSDAAAGFRPSKLDTRSRWWREIESTWLVPVSPPLDQRIEQLGWEADAPATYCERCGTSVGLSEAAAGAPEFGCAACRDERLPWERFVRLSEYGGSVALWVQDTKFTRCHWLGESLGIQLANAVRASGALGTLDSAGKPANSRGVCVVPVATSFWRRVHRGIDHARCIARGMARELGAPLVPALQRAHRPTQRGLSPTAREANVAGAFTLRRGVDLRGKTVILVDDVRTTGATLREAARALGARGTGRRTSQGQPSTGPAHVIVAVVAVTPEPRRKGAVEAHSAAEDSSV